MSGQVVTVIYYALWIHYLLTDECNYTAPSYTIFDLFYVFTLNNIVTLKSRLSLKVIVYGTIRYITYEFHIPSGLTTEDNGVSRPRALLERGRSVQTAMFFLFCLITTLYSNFILKYTTTAWKVNRVVSEHVKTLRPSLLVIMQQFIVN